MITLTQERVVLCDQYTSMRNSSHGSLKRGVFLKGSPSLVQAPCITDWFLMMNLLLVQLQSQQSIMCFGSSLCMAMHTLVTKHHIHWQDRGALLLWLLQPYPGKHQITKYTGRTGQHSSSGCKVALLLWLLQSYPGKHLNTTYTCKIGQHCMCGYCSLITHHVW